MKSKLVLLSVLLLVGCPRPTATTTKPADSAIQDQLKPTAVVDVAWEELSQPSDREVSNIHRTRTPEGWIVTIRSSWDGSLRVIFVPDTKHQWKTSKHVEAVDIMNNPKKHAEHCKQITETFVELMDKGDASESHLKAFIHSTRNAWAAQVEALDD
jgi:hypothetical protein